MSRSTLQEGIAADSYLDVIPVDRKLDGWFVVRHGWQHRGQAGVRSEAMPNRVSRRSFLLGSGSAGLLAACGSADTNDGGPQLVSLFSTDRVLVAGARQRIPFAVVNLGDLNVADTEQVPVRLLFEGEVIEASTVAGRVVDHDHTGSDVDPDHQHADLFRYFALRTELPEPGIYDLEVDFGQGRIARLPIQAFDAAEAGVVQPGQAMPALATPTNNRPLGVEPICTRPVEPCPFHDLSLDDGLADKRALAVLISTPALCSTAYCGPVLETLIEASSDFVGVTPIHLEVYRNAGEVGGNLADPKLEAAASMEGLGLEFEPSLFLVDQNGMVVDRIDNVFDESELRAGLSAISPS